MKKRIKKKYERAEERKNTQRKNLGASKIVDRLSPPSAGNTGADISGGVKMSEILLRLAEPLLQKFGKDFERTRGILTMAMAAWNLSMLPEPTEEETITEMIAKALPKEFSAVDAAVLLDTFYLLMNRRRELFPHMHRIITEIDLRKSETGFDLTVFYAPVQASTETSVGVVSDC